MVYAERHKNAKVLHIRLPLGVYEALEQQARRKNMTTSALVAAYLLEVAQKLLERPLPTNETGES